MTPIYLDYCAGSPLHPAARAFLRHNLELELGNSSSVHRHGRLAESLLNDARDAIARFIRVSAPEVIFTSSGTEANNLALKGLARAAFRAGKGNHIVTLKTEHESVLAPLRDLEKNGFVVTYLDVNSDGVVDIGDIVSAIQTTTILFSCSPVNYEIGTLQNLEHITQAVHGRGVSIHCDAALAFGRYTLYPRLLHIDSLSLSGHKVGAPSGSGALYIRKGLKLEAELHGGAQERGRRPGAVNVLGNAAFGAVVRDVVENKTVTNLEPRTKKLREGILGVIPNAHVNGHPDDRSGILNISFEGIEGASLLMALDLAGISISAGSPCSSGSLEPSPGLLALGVPIARARSSVRFSLGHQTTDAEIQTVLRELSAAVDHLRHVGLTSRGNHGGGRQ